MNNKPVTLLFSLAATGMLALAAGTPSFAATPNEYLKGTYVIVSLDLQHGSVSYPGEDDQLTLTFDGAGNISGSDINLSGGVVYPSSASATYAATADGSFTIASPGGSFSGQLSGDGNTVVIVPLTADEQPQILVGIRQGAVSYLNTASGIDALASNTTGQNNTAFGVSALFSNTTGRGNAAQGAYALNNNTTGIRNLGIGNNALFGNVTGSYNIALGFDAGYNVTTGSYNIEIGAMGTAADTNTIQIGAQGTQTLTKIAGIYNTPVTGSAVYVTSTGQLGVQASSERYKTDIAALPEPSEKLQQLRPVTFHYKTDPKGVPQYGLIAEEVNKVYPELVIRDDSGEIQGVHYEELAPMLLSEVQTLHSELQSQQAAANAQAAEIERLTQQVAELADLKQQLQAALLRLKTPAELTAQR